MISFEPLEASLGIKFQNPQLLRQAFTHSSYVNESKAKGRITEDNERLEFLGDAVLELCISEFLYRTYSNMSEGDMTKLRAAIVCEPSLKSFADALDFGRYLLLGKGEELTGGRSRPSLLADVFESFIGALYLDRGYDAVNQFLEKLVFPKILEGSFSRIHDFKSQLQEVVQRRGLGAIMYRIVDERGPAHHREFVAEVLLNNQLVGRGSGRSKKEAEQKAAEEALQALTTA